MTTAADGTFSCTFATAFPTGVIPAVCVTPVGDGAKVYNHQITSVTATSVSGKVTMSASQSTAAIVVHIVAVAPN